MTLIELLLAISVLAVVMAWAVPAFDRLITRYGIMRTGHELMDMLAMARQMAVSRSAPVLLCTPQAAGQCSREWQGQLVLFVDANLDGALSEGEEVIHRSGHFPEHFFIHWSSFRNKPYIEWNQLGQTNASNGTLTLCAGGKPGRQIVLNRVGRARVVRDSSDETASALCRG